MHWYWDVRVWVHATLTAIMAGLSLTLALPGDTMSNPSWQAFALFGSETTWSHAFMVAAWFGALGLGSSRRWVLLGSTFALSMAHTTVAWEFYRGSLMSHTPNTGVLTYAFIAGLGYVLCLIRFAGR